MVPTRNCHALKKGSGFNRGYCERSGQAEYAGRCWQHRPLARDEKEAVRKAKIAKTRATDWYETELAALRVARIAYEKKSEELLEWLSSNKATLPKAIRARVEEVDVLNDAWIDADANVDLAREALGAL
jgi:hypothetical protein